MRLKGPVEPAWGEQSQKRDLKSGLVERPQEPWPSQLLTDALYLNEVQYP